MTRSVWVGKATKERQAERLMKFGYMMQVQMPRPWSETTEREAYWNAVEQAVAAEEAGFDRIWLTE